jgi:hypothetical protein
MLRKHIAEDTGGIAVNYNEFKFLRRRRGAGIFRFCLPSSAAIVDVTFTATVPRTLIGLTVDETAEFERLDRLSPVDRSANVFGTLRESQRRQTRSDGWSSIENTKPVRARGLWRFRVFRKLTSTLKLSKQS